MNLKNAAILVVDDDPDVLTAIRLLLKPQVKEIVAEKKPREHSFSTGEANFRPHIAGHEFYQLYQYRE